MMKSFFSLIAFLTLAFAQQAQAYFVAVPAAQPALDLSKPVRVLLPGRGTDLGIQPQQSALGRGLQYKSNFPEDQLVLISVFENSSNKKNLLKAGWKFLVENEQTFETKTAVAELQKFKKIRSLDFFGHNSPSLGTQTDGLGFRFDFREPSVAALAPKFIENSYVMIHGCNSGWIIAQDLSKIWNIPVSGSFTETRFERLHSNGRFYVADEEKAPSNEWAKVNSFGTSCEFGGCLRMRPKFSAYHKGKWGTFDGPMLSHYKFFCQLETTECEKRMALSLYGFVSSHSLKKDASEKDFATLAREYLCPVYPPRAKYPNQETTEECYQFLTDIGNGKGNPEQHFVYSDDQLTCTMKACTGKMTCDLHTCTITGRSSEKAMTLAQEYGHMLRGYRALQEAKK
jgi:hypothetical protein